MDIQSKRDAGAFLITLEGRLDATWADPVQAALEAAIRAGEHRIVMDFAGVDYVSSAGLRVVIAGYKQLRAIQGGFTIRAAQPTVAKVIELSGLGVLLQAPEPVAAPPGIGQSFESASAAWESHGTGASVTLRAVGGATAFETGTGELVEFPLGRFGLGVAALAGSREEALPRLGESLFVAGCATHLSSDGANRPDFVISEQAFIPSGWVSSGLVADGQPGLLLRFEVRPESRGIPLAELARTALEASGSSVAAFVVVAETAGLVGASLRRPPSSGEGDPFAFPGVRDRLSFTSERAFRDTTCLLVGVVAGPQSAWSERLRPLDATGSLHGHIHAGVFPYRPIRKGAIALDETVRGLFDAGGLQALLHLLNDTREPEGSGDSEFHRGACWVAPIANANEP